MRRSRTLLMMLCIFILNCNCSRRINTDAESKDDVEEIENISQIQSSKNIDSILGNWQLTAIRTLHYYQVDGRACKDVVYEKKLFREKKSIAVTISKDGKLFMNDTLVGTWTADSLKNTITIDGKNGIIDYPIYFKTPYFISVQAYTRTLTAKFEDKEGNRYWTEYTLIFPD